MNFSLFATKALSALVLPPLNLILLCAVGLMLRRRLPRLGLALSAFALIVLTIISTPAGALMLAIPLENLSMPLTSARNTGAQAIVVLGGGRIRHAPEYGGRDIPHIIPLARLRYAAHLQRETGLPVLVSGGAPEGDTESEATIMARSLREDFGVPVKWMENGSDDTRQNAALSAKILMPEGVRRILLVTDRLHMARAQTIFADAGFEVIPAPASLISHGRLIATDFIPSGDGMLRAHYAMHEWLGIVWNWVKSLRR